MDGKSRGGSFEGKSGGFVHGWKKQGVSPWMERVVVY